MKRLLYGIAYIDSLPKSITLFSILFSVSVGEVHEIRVQPLLLKRSGVDFPSSPMSPSTPLSPRTPSTPGFFDDLGSLDPSLYTMVAEV